MQPRNPFLQLILMDEEEYASAKNIIKSTRRSVRATLIISAMATVLLIACPMAFKTISRTRLSWLRKIRKEIIQAGDYSTENYQEITAENIQDAIM